MAWYAVMSGAGWMAEMSQGLDRLLRMPGIWRGDGMNGAATAIRSGFPALDRCLPGRGWPNGVLTEICPQVPGSGEISLVLPALAALTGGGDDDDGWVAWISPPHPPYPPALAAGGVRLSRLLLIQAGDSADTLWGMEQALRSGSCRAVLGWVDGAGERSLRRLQLAAESASAWAVLYRPVERLATASPAALRLRLEADTDALAIHVLKNRGGQPSQCRIPWEQIVAGDGGGAARRECADPGLGKYASTIIGENHLFRVSKATVA